MSAFRYWLLRLMFELLFPRGIEKMHMWKKGKDLSSVLELMSSMQKGPPVKVLGWKIMQKTIAWESLESCWQLAGTPDLDGPLIWLCGRQLHRFKNKCIGRSRGTILPATGNPVLYNYMWKNSFWISGTSQIESDLREVVLSKVYPFSFVLL